MSKLIEHAETELRRAGMFEKSSDYDGMLGEAVMALVKVFAAQGHSGFSAMRTLQLFNHVARFKTLTPITNDPDEWMQIADESQDTKNTWQSRRASSCFSNDGGKTHYDIDAGDNRAVRVTEAAGAR